MSKLSELVRGIYHYVLPYRIRIVMWAGRRRLRRRLIELRRGLNQELARRGRSELASLLLRHKNTKGTIIIAPSADWETPLIQRSHQMARAFASMNYLVFYATQVDSADDVETFRMIDELLFLANVPVSIYAAVPSPIVICYTYNLHWAERIPRARIVYELIDHLDIFSDYPALEISRNHKRALREASLVIGTADELVAEMRKLRPDALLNPNGVDARHFEVGKVAIEQLPDDIRSIAAEGKPIIGYYGALAEWFDFELVKHAAREAPGFNFVLIGPDYEGTTIASSGIQDFPNIYWLGPKRYHDLPLYLSAFTVATIPFAVTEALQAVSPIKLFEYMAGERPVVTTDLVECRKYPVVLIARTRDEWVAHLHKAVVLRQDPAYIERVRATAEQNTWEQRAEQVSEALTASTDPGSR